MKKLLFLIVTLLCVISCSEDAQIPEVTPPVEIPTPNDEPKPVADDSIYYTTEMDGFELVAASKNGYSLFMQTDTLFAFKCLYDTCQTLNLVAYCDSTGMVERIITEDKVFNFLYHEDGNKVDVFYQKEGKMEWLKDMENPYTQLSSRAEEGNVPYSAISVQNRLSYAIYTIIDTYPLDINKKLSRLVKGFSIPALSVKLATEQIATILGKSFDKTYIDNHYGTIVTVMNDYARWVMNELYGDAFPDTHTWVERVGNDSVRVNCHIIGEDSTKVDYRIGLLIESGDNIVNTLFTAKKAGIMRFTCKSLSFGRKYKIRPFLAPLASSEYLSDMKCFLDYRRFGDSDTFYLFEVKSNVISQGVDEATIKLSTEMEDYHKNFKMGVCYGTNPDLLNSDYMVKDIEVESLESNHDGAISKEIVLENLKSDTTYYYIPYIQYDGNIVNRHLSNMLDAVYEEDKIFYGEKGTFKTTDDSSIREVLTRIYNECNGVNWSYQKNWCTDLPVTEWQGIRRDNNGIYHFDFMSLNELTGTFTIENCSEKIALYNCDSEKHHLEGLYLKNCSNIICGYDNYDDKYLVHTFDMLELSKSFKNIYLDNVLFLSSDVNIKYDRIEYIIYDSAVENIEIRNCKGVSSIVIFDCSNLVNFICEDLSFSEVRKYEDSSFSNSHISIIHCNIENFNSKNNQGFFDIFISDCKQMENIYIENTKTKYHPFVNQCQIIMRNSMVDSFSCKGRGDNLGFYSEEPSIVRNLFIEGIDVNQMYIDFITGLKKIEAEGCSFENRNGTSYSPFLFNHFNDLKEAYFSGCTFGGQGLNLNGCGKLERLFCVDIGHVNEPEAIDVRNTPSLKEFSCYGYAKEILFDSHMNDVNIDCEGLNILQMIPDCYTGEGEGSFRYDQRYEYVYKHLPDGGYEYEKTIDHGRGWWYPGEPASKSHSRQ